MLMKVHDREFRHTKVKELDAPVSARDNKLVFIDLGPREVILGVIRVEAGWRKEDGLGKEDRK